MAALNKKIALLAVIITLRRRRQRKAARHRSIWTQTWLQRRQLHGFGERLLPELRLEDAGSFRRFTRLTCTNFDTLVTLLTPALKRQDTYMRRAISVEERLAITMKFLATGETFRSLSFGFRAGERTISEIVKETCFAIYEGLKDQYLKTPSTCEDWEKVASGFLNKWNYPHCLGAIDGKHVAITQPKNSGSLFFNYKHFFSIILMAIVDADYKFIYVDVGANGRCGDAGVFADCSFKQAMDRETLSFPNEQVLPGTNKTCRYHLIADDAFPLRTDVMKPYPHRTTQTEQKIYNYRLSRARRVVENAFGILANRFRVLLTKINLEPDHVQYVVLAACCLHNYCMQHQSTQYLDPHQIDQEDENHNLTVGTWRTQRHLEGLKSSHLRNFKQGAKEQRETLKDYFSSEVGSVPWQDSMI